MAKKLSLVELCNAYKVWVQSNPNTVTDVETVLTWSSYFISGKINKSPIVSELVYSMSKLLSLYNDRLIRQNSGAEVISYSLREQLKLWLTVIHYCEVFVELVIRKKWGSEGKWTAATCLQIAKCVANITLLYKFKEVPIQHPPIPVLQRKKFAETVTADENSNGSYKLRRSGRVIRSIEGAPPVAFRDWQPVNQKNEPTSPNVGMKDVIHAETVYILKPLIHLLSMKAFGTKAWKQWLVSISLDLISLRIYNKYMKDLSYDQRLEVNRRKLALLLYLLRSPMYCKFSKNIVESTLNTASNKIPLAGIICNPVLQYLSHWQDIYFYMWAS